MRIHGALVLALAFTLMGGLVLRAGTRPPEAQRMDAFNDLESDNLDKAFYRGVTIRGKVVIIRLSDRWNALSPDRKEALCKGMFTRWFALGKVRGIQEQVGHFKFEFRHVESDRLLATWDGLSGITVKHP